MVAAENPSWSAGLLAPTTSHAQSHLDPRSLSFRFWFGVQTQVQLELLRVLAEHSQIQMCKTFSVSFQPSNRSRFWNHHSDVWPMTATIGVNCSLTYKNNETFFFYFFHFFTSSLSESQEHAHMGKGREGLPQAPMGAFSPSAVLWRCSGTFPY